MVFDNRQIYLFIWNLIGTVLMNNKLFYKKEFYYKK